jgi:hypothetical protein
VEKLGNGKEIYPQGASRWQVLLCGKILTLWLAAGSFWNFLIKGKSFRRRIMKKLVIVVGLIAAVMMLSSCWEKGGTIEVTNDMSTPTTISVTKGLLPSAPLTPLAAGDTEIYSFDEDGTYVVSASLPLLFSKTVTLTGGKTEKVSIK